MASQAAPEMSLGTFVEALLKLFSSHTVDDIVYGRDGIVEVNSGMKMAAAFQTLVDSRVLSAPCRDLARSTPEKVVYSGFLDVRDLVKYAIFTTETETAHSSLAEMINESIKARADVSENVTPNYLAKMHPFRSVSEGAHLMEVISFLGHGTGRVAVVDATGQVVKIVSQSSVLEFLMRNEKAIFGSSAPLDHRLPLASIPGLIHKPVVCALESNTALAMFKAMDKQNLSSVAVLAKDTGRLIGQTSSSDLKQWLRRRQSLKQPVIDFLAQVRRSDAAADIRYPIVSLRETDSVHNLIARLVATKLHRVFIVDEAGKPQGVVSLSDLLKVFLNGVERE